MLALIWVRDEVGFVYKKLRFYDFLSISFGASLGALSRYFILEKLKAIFNGNYIAISILNFSSSFALGFVFGINPNWYSQKNFSILFLLVTVGFFGSLSSFSTFIFEALLMLLDGLRSKAIIYTMLSLILSICAAAFGYLLCT